MRLTAKKITAIAACFPQPKVIDVTYATIDAELIFHEYEVSSYFPNPQDISVRGLDVNFDTFISRLNK